MSSHLSERGQVWETTLGTVRSYEGMPVLLLRFARQRRAGMVTLTSPDGLQKRTVEWAWGDYGDVRSMYKIPAWLLELIEHWHANLSCILGHLDCQKHPY